MCLRGILPDSIPEPAHTFRTSPSTTSLPSHRLLLRHRAALLRPVGRQNPDRDPHPGHAPLRHDGQRVPVAVRIHDDDPGLVASFTSSEPHGNYVINGDGSPACTPAICLPHVKLHLHIPNPQDYVDFNEGKMYQKCATF